VPAASRYQKTQPAALLRADRFLLAAGVNFRP
jgi:hypothetical protein